MTKHAKTQIISKKFLKLTPSFLLVTLTYIYLFIFYIFSFMLHTSVIIISLTRYLNFYSQYPLTQKQGTVISMTDRALLALSHSKFYNKSLCFVINTLLNNDYLLNFIFDIINKRLKY